MVVDGERKLVRIKLNKDPLYPMAANKLHDEMMDARCNEFFYITQENIENMYDVDETLKGD